MKLINTNNYEAYLLDYTEGNLSSKLINELTVFINENPQLNIHLDELELITVDVLENCLFQNKKELYKTEKDLISENTYISLLENTLTTQEKSELENTIAKYPSLREEFELYQHTILKPNTAIVFPNKNKLKKKPMVLWFPFSAAQLSIAATVVLLLSVFFIWKNSNNGISNNINNQIAITDSQHIKTIIQMKDTSNKILERNLMKNKEINISEKTDNKKQSTKTTKQKLNTLINTFEKQSVALTIDSTLKEKSKTLIEQPKTEELVLETKKPYIVETINEEEIPEIKTKPVKPSFWNVAASVLNNLHKAGIKPVNGIENKKTETYALKIGEFTLSHTKSN